MASHYYERLTFRLCRQMESRGYFVARWKLADRQEIRAGRIGDDQLLSVQVNGHDEQAMYRAALELAQKVGVKPEEQAV